MERLQHALTHARRYQRQLGVLSLDLDQFKRINDTLGHKAGNELLVAVSQRLCSVVRGSDLMGREDADPGRGTGVTAAQPTSIHLLDAWHRAARAHANRPRRDAMRRRGMTADWSWREPALAHIEHYERIATS